MIVENHKEELMEINDFCSDDLHILAIDLTRSKVYRSIEGMCIPHYCFVFKFCSFCGKENKNFSELVIDWKD